MIRNNLIIACILLFIISMCFFEIQAQTTPSESDFTENNREDKIYKKILSLNRSGVLLWKEREYRIALDTFTEALELSKKIKDDSQIASSLNNIGLVYYSQGRFYYMSGILQPVYTNP